MAGEPHDRGATEPQSFRAMALLGRSAAKLQGHRATGYRAAAQRTEPPRYRATGGLHAAATSPAPPGGLLPPLVGASFASWLRWPATWQRPGQRTGSGRAAITPGCQFPLFPAALCRPRYRLVTCKSSCSARPLLTAVAVQVAQMQTRTLSPAPNMHPCGNWRNCFSARPDPYPFAAHFNCLTPVHPVFHVLACLPFVAPIGL
jgi:hypothetical protein